MIIATDAVIASVSRTRGVPGWPSAFAGVPLIGAGSPNADPVRSLVMDPQ
jgi:hypothetical protein